MNLVISVHISSKMFPLQSSNNQYLQIYINIVYIFIYNLYFIYYTLMYECMIDMCMCVHIYTYKHNNTHTHTHTHTHIYIYIYKTKSHSVECFFVLTKKYSLKKETTRFSLVMFYTYGMRQVVWLNGHLISLF
jgi:dynactin complex subunit